MSKLHELLPILSKIAAGNHKLTLSAAIHIVSKQGILYSEAQHPENMAGNIFTDASVGIAHLLVPTGMRRKLQHKAVSFIGDIDLITVGPAVSAEPIDRTVGKIDYRDSLLYRYFARR